MAARKGTEKIARNLVKRGGLFRLSHHMIKYLFNMRSDLYVGDHQFPRRNFKKDINDG